MKDLVRRVQGQLAEPGSQRFSDPDAFDGEHPSNSREWLVTNGLGGYASGTVSGSITRRFHGLLIAALPAPQGRTMMLNHLSEVTHLKRRGRVGLSAREEHDGSLFPTASLHLTEFRLESGLPVWRYEIDDVVVEKRLCLVHGQNTVVISYELLRSEESVRMELQPWVNFRPHEGPLDAPIDEPCALTVQASHYELAKQGFPPLRLQVRGERPSFTISGKNLTNVRYPVEASRGYDAVGSLQTPGHFTVDLTLASPVSFVASTEPWEVLSTAAEDAFDLEQLRRAKTASSVDPSTREGMGGELVFAADQFVIAPAGRLGDAARARAAGEEVRTIIAGYHWFTDWGRDTMISLEGLTLTTGRFEEAGYILRTFGHYVRDGLLPNMFPEGRNAGLYHTADATLWFFHAIDRYLEYTDDRDLLVHLMPTLRSIVDHHVRGTRFGIGVDPDDGLLRQGAAGYQLTWMDAKVGDFVVTPRRGKAVEINALFYNALKLLEGWEHDSGEDARAGSLSDLARRTQQSFQARFWYEKGQYLFDVVDGESGDDAALRPNQIFAISLRHPVLDPARWPKVVAAVENALLTPVGLRSLAPSNPDYKPKYFGDLRSRDTAYHQGTVWAWLIGPFVDAWLKVHPGQQLQARRFLEGFTSHLSEACIGSISEIFDADAPFTPRGCIAQAWSVAEVLRCWAKTGPAPA